VSQQPIYAPNVTPTLGPNGGVLGQSQAVVLGVHRAWVVVALWAVVALGVAVSAFRTRDVT
jgi:hypothetical protein